MFPQLRWQQLIPGDVPGWLSQVTFSATAAAAQLLRGKNGAINKRAALGEAVQAALRGEEEAPAWRAELGRVWGWVVP